MKVSYANSIEEAINDAEVFLECDLYTKFRPEQKLPTGNKKKIEKWYRKDVFPNEREFIKYIRDHFKILSEEIIRGIGKKKFSAKFKSFQHQRGKQ